MTDADHAVILAAIFLRNQLIQTPRIEERIRKREALLVFAVGELPQCDADLTAALDESEASVPRDTFTCIRCGHRETKAWGESSSHECVGPNAPLQTTTHHTLPPERPSMADEMEALRVFRHALAKLKGRG